MKNVATTNTQQFRTRRNTSLEATPVVECIPAHCALWSSISNAIIFYERNPAMASAFHSLLFLPQLLERRHDASLTLCRTTTSPPASFLFFSWTGCSDAVVVRRGDFEAGRIARHKRAAGACPRGKRHPKTWACVHRRYKGERVCFCPSLISEG